MKFETQFNKTKKTIEVFSRRFSKATNIPVEEYTSALNEEFSRKFERYDGRIPFDSFIKPILHQRAQRVAERRERKFYANVIHVDGLVDDEGESLFEFADEGSVEEIALDRIEKAPDKLLLIQDLLEKSDEFTVAAVKLILEKPNASLNSIATEMGVHHTKVGRSLKRLAKNYDPSRFGDLSQYLAV